MILVVSVHADDGLYSCGEFVANQVAHGTNVVVLSLCSATPWDQDSAWQEQLNVEHQQACGALGAMPAFGGYYDGKWDGASALGEATEADVLFRLFAKVEQNCGQGASAILVPLGIRHPDHLYFAGAALRAARERPSRVAIYEDLPYRVLYPEEAAVRRRWLVEGGGELESASNGGYYDEKLAACQQYRSQWGDDARRCVMAPERIWWTK